MERLDRGSATFEFRPTSGDVWPERFDLCFNACHCSTQTYRATHAVSGKLNCDRTVISQAWNLEENRGLRTHTE